MHAGRDLARASLVTRTFTSLVSDFLTMNSPIAFVYRFMPLGMQKWPRTARCHTTAGNQPRRNATLEDRNCAS